MKSFLLILVLIIFASCKSTQNAVVEESQTPPPPPTVEEVELVEAINTNTNTTDVTNAIDTNAINTNDINTNEIYINVIDTDRNELIFPYGTSIRETARGKILVVDTKAIYDFASTNISTNTYAALGQVIEFMNSNENVNIIIEGHTSNIGIAYPYNYNLSVERARNVKIYLVNSGIVENRLMESPLGESLPEYPNQADLRRNEFVVITSREDLIVYNDFVSKLDVRKETTYTEN